MKFRLLRRRSDAKYFLYLNYRLYKIKNDKVFCIENNFLGWRNSFRTVKEVSLYNSITLKEAMILFPKLDLT